MVDPRRSKFLFIDDSGIESDGEGGDVFSTPTTSASSRPSSPGRVEAPSSIPTIDSSVRSPIAKAPRARCEYCNTEFSGPEQLQVHLKGKKHKKKVRNSCLSSCCKLCRRCFTSNHNFINHKYENCMTKEKYSIKFKIKSCFVLFLFLPL